jgi:hypothetical protein
MFPISMEEKIVKNEDIFDIKSKDEGSMKCTDNQISNLKI